MFESLHSTTKYCTTAMLFNGGMFAMEIGPNSVGCTPRNAKQSSPAGKYAACTKLILNELQGKLLKASLLNKCESLTFV